MSVSNKSLNHTRKASSLKNTIQNEQPIDWNKVALYVSKQYAQFHSKKIHITPQKRLEMIRICFTDLLSRVYHHDNDEIKVYIEKRDEENKKLRIIEQKVKTDIEEMLDTKEVYSASSFSANTNLSGESDLDFNIPFDILDKKLVQLSNQCGLYGYKFVEVRSEDNPGIHYVFQKIVDDVEIEVKLRHKPFYIQVHHKMHDYLDNHMPQIHKDTITWIKHKLNQLSKQNSTKKKAYKLFKAMYYEQAISHAQVYKMLYPLE